MHITFEEALQEVHRQYEGNEDFPDVSSEDFIIRRSYGNKMIRTWEREVRNGIFWNALKKNASFVASGTGTDSLTTHVSDFLSFIRQKDTPAYVSDGSRTWREVSVADGSRAVMENDRGYVFWVEGTDLRTFPEISGTVSFPYVRKATQYPVGTETIPIDIDEEDFLIDGILASLYIKDKNTNMYNVSINNVEDALERMKDREVGEVPKEGRWGFGM